MTMRRRFGTALSIIALLSACGGGGGGGGGNDGSGTPPPTGTTPPPTTAGCTLRERQDWATAQIREWYLFPETLPANTTPTTASVEAHIDMLTATARAQGRDRFFTYLTSIAEENAFIQSGSTAGFGVRLALNSAQRRLLISEAYEGAPALAAGIDRGTEILAIGTSAGDLRTVDAIMLAEGSSGLSNALGPATVGTTRLLRIRDAQGTRDVTVSKAEFDLPPVSNRYGARILDDGGKRVGYLNLRSFGTQTADPALRSAFASFKAAGITEVIVDMRYNGGGLVSIANLLGDLLGGNRQTTDVFSITAFRPEKASNNSTRFFSPKAESIAPTKIAFIGTASTASASELVINSMVPYLKTNAALIGTNTYGKPVGQIALDRTACDDRLRVIAFATQNADRQGDYFGGLATTMPASCQAGDDLSRQLGDPQEASTRQALDFLAGRSCTRIAAGASAQSLGERTLQRELLTPDRPNTAQREAPGTF
jgi:C-terminal processing protease CtpA/Prc